ncbi:MAG: hypothetical protein WA231_23775 [Methylocella sp.]
MLRSYLDANHALFDKIEFSEKQIEISLGDGVSVNGRIDRARCPRGRSHDPVASRGVREPVPDHVFPWHRARLLSGHAGRRSSVTWTDGSDRETPAP